MSWSGDLGPPFRSRWALICEASLTKKSMWSVKPAVLGEAPSQGLFSFSFWIFDRLPLWQVATASDWERAIVEYESMFWRFSQKTKNTCFWFRRSYRRTMMVYLLTSVQPNPMTHNVSTVKLLLYWFRMLLYYWNHSSTSKTFFYRQRSLLLSEYGMLPIRQDGIAF